MKRLIICLAALAVCAAGASQAGSPAALNLSELCGAPGLLGLQDPLNLDDGLRPTAHGWSLYADDIGTIVDLGSGNKGIRQSSDAGSDWDQWLKTYQLTRLAIHARFMIEAEASSGNIMQLAAKGVTPEVGIGIRSHHICAVNYKNNQVVADFGPVVLGQFYEGGLYVDAASKTAGWWLSGQGANGVFDVTATCGTAFAEFGASTYDWPQGSATITYDWVGVYAPEPSSLVALLLGVAGLVCRRRA